MLTVGDFRDNDKFKKTGNWARIHQRFGKTSIEVTKRGILTNGNYNKKMANLGEKGKFSKNGEYAKNSSRVWPNIQMR